MAAKRVTGPPANGAPTEEFVEEWRNAAYSCFSSGHKFCREVCPVMQVTRDEAHTPTAFHANVVAMEKGHLGIEDVARRLRPLHPVRRLRAALPEHALHRRLLPLPHAHRRSGQGDAGVRRRPGHPPAGAGSAGTSSPTARAASRCSTDVPVSQDHVRRLGRRPRPPRRRRDDPLLRLRGRVPPHVAAARGRAGAEGRRASSSGSCASSGAAAGRPPRWATSTRRGASPSTTSPTGAPSARTRILVLDPHDYITFTEDYPRYFGDDYDFEIVLVVELARRADPRGAGSTLDDAGRADGHLPRRLPAEQAQGHPRGAAGDPAGDPRPHLQGRRPRDAVVVLLGGRRAASRSSGPT